MRLLRSCRPAASGEREDPEHGPHREGEKTAQLLKRSEVNCCCENEVGLGS